MNSEQQPRWHGLDALRGLALILGVLLHATMSFIPGSQFFWVVSDSSQSAVPGVMFYVIHMFRMATFFLLAGFFGRMLYHRLGARGFARDRWKRVVTPLLVGWPIALVAIVVVVVWGALINSDGNLPQNPPPGPKFTPDDFPLTHLWFLWDLLLAYVAFGIMRSIVARLDSSGRLRSIIDRVVGSIASSPVAALVFALPLAAALYFTPSWYQWFGIPTPDKALYPNLASIAGFGSAFVLGWLLQRQPDVLRIWEKRWALHLVLAVAATIGCLAMVGLTSPPAPAAREWSTAAYAVVYAVGVWSWTMGLTGASLRFLSGFSAKRRYLADASYWIYLAHLPLVMALQVVASRVDWGWQIELPLVLASALAILLVSYETMVRYTFIGARLNGPRGRGIVAPNLPLPALRAEN